MFDRIGITGSRSQISSIAGISGQDTVSSKIIKDFTEELLYDIYTDASFKELDTKNISNKVKFIMNHYHMDTRPRSVCKLSEENELRLVARRTFMRTLFDNDPELKQSYINQIVEFIFKHDKDYKSFSEVLGSSFAKEVSEKNSVLLATAKNSIKGVATKTILTEVGEAAAEAGKIIKPKGPLGIVSGVVGGAVLNVLLDDSHKSNAAGRYDTDQVSNFYRSKFREEDFDKAFALYQRLYNPKTEKDYNNFFKNSNIYIYTKFAKDEQIKNMSDKEIKDLIQIGLKYGSRDPINVTVSKAKCWEAVEKLYNR